MPGASKLPTILGLVYTFYGGYIAVEYTNLICLLRLHCTYPFSLWPWLTYSRIIVYSDWPVRVGYNFSEYTVALLYKSVWLVKAT